MRANRAILGLGVLVLCFFLEDLRVRFRVLRRNRAQPEKPTTTLQRGGVAHTNYYPAILRFW